MHTSNLLSVHEVAIRLSASEDTVIDLARDGTLPARLENNSYWFEPNDIEAYINTYPAFNPPGDGSINDLIYPKNNRSGPSEH